MSANEGGAARSRIESWFLRLQTWPRRGVAVAAGLAATLGHAPYGALPLFALGLVTLVWLLDASTQRPNRLASAFAMGWYFGFGHLASGLYWVSSAFMVDTTAWGPLWGIPAALALAGGLALFWGAGCMLAMALWTNDVRRLAAFALSIFATEWLRGHLFGGLPWLLSGYVWPPGGAISQLASVIGIYGLTLLTLLVAVAPASIADGRLDAGSRFAPIVAAALLFGMGWGWGEQRVAHRAVDPPGAQPIVRVADAGMSQAEKWTYRPDQEWRVLQRYLEVSGDPNTSDAQVLVWPEGAIPVVNFFMLENPEFMSALGRGLGDRALIVGLTRRAQLPDRIGYYNSAAVIDGVSGAPRLSQIYDKHRLVPFGEFIPLWSLVSNLNIAPLQRIGAGFDAGAMPTRLVVPEAPPAVVLICYEAIFPGMVPHGDERPGWIVMVTNDAWFGGGAGPAQHYVMARYRAIEEGLPVARAASGGVSAIIDSYGRAVRETQGGRAAGVEAQLPPALAETIWARQGALNLVILLVFVAALRFFPAAGLSRGRRDER